MEKITTSDLYYGAYLMSNGGRLEGAIVKGKDRRKVQFKFAGPKITKLAHEYITGEATVNVRYLRSSMEHLKDIIFEKINTVKEYESITE
jgi:hypothetical protein